jgi:hypothetical protein
LPSHRLDEKPFAPEENMSSTDNGNSTKLLDLLDPMLGHPRAKAREIERVSAANSQVLAALESLHGERMRIIDRYLRLIQDCLTGSLYEDPPLKTLGQMQFDARLREYGWDWPSRAHTMIGRKRLENVRSLTESVLGNNIPGDLMETGVWRGGACILMRAVLDAYRVTDRKVWLADSFEGLPPPDADNYPADQGDTFHTFEELAVSLEQVQENFRKYGLLDDQLVFLKGWFKDTLPSAPVDKLALLRLDGDMYESTIVALENLYPKLSIGGYVIVDDYHVVPACKQAIDDFSNANNFIPLIEEIDGVGIFWRKAN